MSQNCPMCHKHLKPVYRALCNECFDVIPWRTRSDYLLAWRMRASNPLHFQEQYVRTKQIYDELPPVRRKDFVPNDEL